MNYFKLRIDTCDTEKVLLMCTQYCDIYLCAYEGIDTPNPHCHIYGETISSLSALRVYIRRNFGTGNRCYSLKAITDRFPLEYLSYCLKEGTYDSYNIPDDILENAKNHDLRVKNEMKSKRRKKGVMSEIIEEMKLSNCFALCGKKFLPNIGINDVVHHIMEYYMKRDVLVRKFFIVSLAQTIMCKYDAAFRMSFEQSIIDMVVPPSF